MLQFMSRHRSPLLAGLKTDLRATGISNIFNLSIQHSNAGFIVTFRGLKRGAKKPFDAFIGRCDVDGRLVAPVVSLGEHYAAELGVPVCDPKLLRSGSRCWMTFNTGHFEKPNRIFVAQVEPDLGPLWEVAYDGRSKIEKNWAFFEHDGALHALYNAAPTIVLREAGRFGQTIRFERLSIADTAAGKAKKKTTKQPQITIGTQPVLLDDAGTYGFIGHRRWYWRGKRIYLGTPMTLRMNNGAPDVVPSGKLWAHSLPALFGDRIKHNPNLISCTYFAGMSVSDGRALVSYGINDVDFSMAEMPLTGWKS